MKDYERRSDVVIEEIQKDVKEIKKLLLGNGKIGICEQVRNNEKEISYLKSKPNKIKGWLVAAAIIINTLVAGIALYKGL